MIERTEPAVAVLTDARENGEKYIARIENGVADIQVQTVETYVSLRVPVAAIAPLTDFLTAVAADPAAAVVAESDPAPEAGSSDAPVEEPTPEEAVNG